MQSQQPTQIDEVTRLNNIISDLNIDKNVLDQLYGEQIRSNFQFRKQIQGMAETLNKLQNSINSLNAENAKLQEQVKSLTPINEEIGN